MTTDEIISGVLDREGWPLVTNRAADKGGLTKGGVTLRNYNAWLAKLGRTQIHEQQLRDLPEAAAREFFMAAFFGPFLFVTSQEVFILLGDWATTSGPDDPARGLQKVLAALKLYAGKIDGAPGPKTQAAWRAAMASGIPWTRILARLVIERVVFYQTIAFDSEVREFLRTHPKTQLHNARGWERRALHALESI